LDDNFASVVKVCTWVDSFDASWSQHDWEPFL
jgi:hypothetical protein